MKNKFIKINKNTSLNKRKNKTIKKLIEGFTNPEPNKNPLSVFKIDFGR